MKKLTSLLLIGCIILILLMYFNQCGRIRKLWIVSVDKCSIYRWKDFF